MGGKRQYTLVRVLRRIQGKQDPITGIICRPICLLYISPHIPRKKIRHSWKMSSTQKCHVLPTGYTLKKYNCNLKSRAVFIELHENFNSQGERSIQSQVQINRNMHLNLQRTQVVFLMSFTLVVSHLIIKYKINCQCITQPTMNDKSSFQIQVECKMSVQ